MGAETVGRLTGKVAVITGGGRGIGAVTAKLFCAEGAKLLLVDQNDEALASTAAEIRVRQANAVVETLAADVVEPAAAERVVRLALERFRGLSVLVNNAAMRNVSGIEAADPAEWQRVLATNVIGTINFCRAALPALKASGKAGIVNVSSCYAVRGRQGFAAYDASKAALLAITRTLAAEGAEYGIRANAVCPGGTLTPFTIGRQQERGRSETEMRAEHKRDSLLGRWAEPIEIAYPILWLASDEASYVTGATLMVDGGQP